MSITYCKLFQRRLLHCAHQMACKGDGRGRHARLASDTIVTLNCRVLYCLDTTGNLQSSVEKRLTVIHVMHASDFDGCTKRNGSWEIFQFNQNITQIHILQVNTHLHVE